MDWEKAKKFDVMSKLSGRFFQIFVPFSEKLNFNCSRKKIDSWKSYLLEISWLYIEFLSKILYSFDFPTLLQKWGHATIGHEKDTSEVISDHDVFCEQEKPETQISEKNSQFLRLMTEKVCPSDLNEETLNLKIDDVVSELAESLPKIGQFCISYLIK